MVWFVIDGLNWVPPATRVPGCKEFTFGYHYFCVCDTMKFYQHWFDALAKNVQYTIFKIIPLRLCPPLHRHHNHQHRRRCLLLLLRRWCLMAPQIPRSESSHQNLPTKHTDISSLLTYLPTNRTNQPASQPNQTVSQPASHTHIYSVSQFFLFFVYNTRPTSLDTQSLRLWLHWTK